MASIPASQRRYNLIDCVLMELDHALKTLCAKPQAKHPNPAANIPETVLSEDQKAHAAGLMRVDHTGEICAQALYRGQAAVARTDKLKQDLLAAADEENDHLAWCQDRLDEFNSRPSYLNIFWYLASYQLGMIAAIAGDAWSLGFVVETEHQVMKHLDEHLQSLPSNDDKSRAILMQMRYDEEQHAIRANNDGAKDLPYPLRMLMRFKSKLMTKTAYYI